METIGKRPGKFPPGPTRFLPGRANREEGRTRQEKFVLASIGDVLTRIAPEATVVVIFRIVFKLITHAIDDKDRWRRLMFLVVPLLTLVLALAVVAVWWLLGDGGLQVVLHGFGQTATPDRPRK
jgi:hypothetical protein